MSLLKIQKAEARRAKRIAKNFKKSSRDLSEWYQNTLFWLMTPSGGRFRLVVDAERNNIKVVLDNHVYNTLCMTNLDGKINWLDDGQALFDIGRWKKFSTPRGLKDLISITLNAVDSGALVSVK